MRIIKDLKQYSQGSFIKMLVTIFTNPNFHAIVLHRFAYIMYKSKLFVLLAKITQYFIRILYSMDIDYRANLSGGLKIIHGIGIVIGKDVVSKGILTIYQGVTIGGNNRIKEYDGIKHTQPVLMNNVTLYPNSTLFGPITIGENTIVGANTTIFRDIKSNVKVYAKSTLTEIDL